MILRIFFFSFSNKSFNWEDYIGNWNMTYIDLLWRTILLQEASGKYDSYEVFHFRADFIVILFIYKAT